MTQEMMIMAAILVAVIGSSHFAYFYRYSFSLP